MDSVKMASFKVPLLDLSVNAGFPSPAADYMEERININDFLIKHPESTFIVKCTGFSMIEAFIPPQCHLLIDRALEPEDGDVVLAYVNGGFTVKYLELKNRKCRLVPGNKLYKDIEIPEENELIIWGVVTNIISNTKDLKHVRFS